MGQKRDLTGRAYSIRMTHDTIKRVEMLAEAAGISVSDYIRRKIFEGFDHELKYVFICKFFELLGVNDIKDMAKLLDFYKTEIIEKNNKNNGDK